MNRELVNKWKMLIKDCSSIFSNFYYFLFGHKNYGKFVVVTKSRSGSNYLKSLLNNHPEIESEGELFRRLYGRNSFSFWNRNFSFKKHSIRMVGFKLFYYHPLDTNDRSVWDFIKLDTSIKLIHLRRQNLLEMYVSQELANKSNVWSSKDKQVQKIDNRIEIDYEDFIKYCEEIRYWENSFLENFSSHSILEISYEELIKDTNLNVIRIFDFLNVKPVLVSSDFKKQNRNSISSLIINFEIFESRLKESSWSYLLEK